MIIVNIQLFGGNGAKSGAKSIRASVSQKAVGGVNVADSGNSNSEIVDVFEESDDFTLDQRQTWKKYGFNKSTGRDKQVQFRGGLDNWTSDGRPQWAGRIYFGRWGRKAQEKIKKGLEVNENGYMSLPIQGGKHYQIGVSEGKYGLYAKYDNTFFSVNSGGYIYAKKGTPKGDVYEKMLNHVLYDMNHTSMFSYAAQESGNLPDIAVQFVTE